MRILGAFLIILGLLLCLSIVGAVVGIPLIFIGLIVIVVGGRRKTVITNVVQVSNSIPTGADYGLARPSANRVELDHDAAPGMRSIPPMREAIASPRSGPSIADRLGSPSRSESEFQDIEHEISETSLGILRAAKIDGFDVRYQRSENRVVVSRQPDEGEMSLASNRAILAFGRPRGYDR